MKENIKLSIVIPAYNEEKRLPSTLNHLKDYISSQNLLSEEEIELVIVSPNSSDNTHKIASQYKNKFSNFIFINSGRKIGKGNDVKIGMLKARGDAVLFMDADMSTPLEHILEFYNLFLKGNNLIIASRRISTYRRSYIRKTISFIGNILFKISSGIYISDSQCGFKMMSNQVSKMCFNNLSILGWGFDMEILAVANANSIKIYSVTIDDWKDVPGGSFDINLFSNLIISIKDLFLIFIRRVSGSYELERD